MELKRVVVTGMGALTPVGNTIDEYWNGLVKGFALGNVLTIYNSRDGK